MSIFTCTANISISKSVFIDGEWRLLSFSGSLPLTWVSSIHYQNYVAGVSAAHYWPYSSEGQGNAQVSASAPYNGSLYVIFTATGTDPRQTSFSNEVGTFEIEGYPLYVPNIVGMTEANAEAAITNAYMNLGEVTGDYSGEVEEGLVISQDPTAGFEVDPYAYVGFVLSIGPLKAINPTPSDGAVNIEKHITTFTWEIP